MSVTAGGGLGDAPGGRAHHTHLARLARGGLAHLCTDPGIGLALAHALSSPLSAEPSIRFWPDRVPGHSSGSALLRKGTFGAEKWAITSPLGLLNHMSFTINMSSGTLFL